LSRRLGQLGGRWLGEGFVLRPGGGHRLGERYMVNRRGPTLPYPKPWDQPGVQNDRKMKRKDKAFVDCERAWLRVDAQGQVMGHVASKVVQLLCGKHKPIYQPQRDVGDYVVILNAAKVVLTGKKREQKRYYHHTGYPGGLKTLYFEDMFAANPVRPLRLAIWGMMPKNKLKRQRMNRLRLFPGAAHTCESQFRDPQTKAFDVILPLGSPPARLVPMDKMPPGPD